MIIPAPLLAAAMSVASAVPTAPPATIPPAAPAVPATPAAPAPAALPAAAPPSAAPPPAAPPPAATPPPAEPAPAIIVSAPAHPPRSDPLQAVNAQSYAAVQAVDQAFVAPMAHAYQHGLPAPVRDGLHNVLSNLDEPDVALNFLLQHKVGKAAATVARFAINSTVGLAGLIDVAKRKPFRLRYHPNGFADTMGFYGVKPGPYLFLPVIGPTTLRDLIGLGLDRLVLPVAAGRPFNRPVYATGASVVRALDYRVAFDAKLRELHRADNPYAATRADYLALRQAEIDALHGKPPAAVPQP